MTSLLKDLLTQNGMPRLFRQNADHMQEYAPVNQLEKMVLESEDTVEMPTLNDPRNHSFVETPGSIPATLPDTGKNAFTSIAREIAGSPVLGLHIAVHKHIEKHKRVPVYIYLNEDLYSKVEKEILQVYHVPFDGILRSIGPRYVLLAVKVVKVTGYGIPKGYIICQ